MSNPSLSIASFLGISLGFSLVLPAPTHAQTPQVDRIEIVETGIYGVETTKLTPSSDTAAGYLGTVDDIKLMKSTTTIPAEQGTNFGVRYKIVGVPKGAGVEIRLVTKLPTQGLHNPKTGEITFRNDLMVERTIGDVHFRGYSLRNNWEAVPGVWTFEFWYKDQKLAEQKFNVTMP
jgi:hypothetical protein